jgi:hypothetical protein
LTLAASDITLRWPPEDKALHGRDRRPGVRAVQDVAGWLGWLVGSGDSLVAGLAIGLAEA